MADTLELIRGISQAIANSYDGAHDERYSYDGESRKVGLKEKKAIVFSTPVYQMGSE
jgi:hypothetical protein